MEFLTRVIGRYLFGLPFMVFGLIHFINAGGMAPMVPDWLPGGIFWILLTGLALLAAGLSIVIRVWDRTAAFLLGVMLLIFVLTIHLPNTLNDPQVGLGGLLKDTSLAGAAWLYAGYLARSSFQIFSKKRKTR